jgi:hypothetical protein
MILQNYTSKSVDTIRGHTITELHTDDGPCESILREVWFQLPGYQDEALVCVSVPGAGPEDIQVYAQAGSACIAGTLP